MKKIILLVIALIISTNVYAETKYTDYEFIGYTQQQKENDEFYKYEEVLINRFYKLEEKNIEYKEFDEEYSQKFIEKNDKQIEEFISTSNAFALPKERMLTLKAEDNYLTHKLTISDLKDFQKIYQIEIVSFDDITTTIQKEDIKENMTIEFWRAYVENIQIKFYYETNTPIEFQLSIINDSGLTRITRQITLSNIYKNLTINSKRFDHYEEFIKENNFIGLNETEYNKYKRIKYKVYDLEKVYYKDSEETSLDGYSYDTNESIKMYKIFKRDRVAEPEEPKPIPNPVGPSPIEPTQPVPEQTPSTEQTDSKDTINESLNQNKVTSMTNKTNTKKKTTTSKKENVEQMSKIEEEMTKKIETENAGKTYETVDNTSKTNLVEYKSGGNNLTSCDCTPKVNSFTIIGLIMITASLILTGIHYYNVNHQDE